MYIHPSMEHIVLGKRQFPFQQNREKRDGNKKSKLDSNDLFKKEKNKKWFYNI